MNSKNVRAGPEFRTECLTLIPDLTSCTVWIDVVESVYEEKRIRRARELGLPDTVSWKHIIGHLSRTSTARANASHLGAVRRSSEQNGEPEIRPESTEVESANSV